MDTIVKIHPEPVGRAATYRGLSKAEAKARVHGDSGSIYLYGEGEQESVPVMAPVSLNSYGAGTNAVMGAVGTKVWYGVITSKYVKGHMERRLT